MANSSFIIFLFTIPLLASASDGSSAEKTVSVALSASQSALNLGLQSGAEIHKKAGKAVSVTLTKMEQAEENAGELGLQMDAVEKKVAHHGKVIRIPLTTVDVGASDLSWGPQLDAKITKPHGSKAHHALRGVTTPGRNRAVAILDYIVKQDTFARSLLCFIGLIFVYFLTVQREPDSSKSTKAKRLFHVFSRWVGRSGAEKPNA
eukprot:TRINITY_DN63627_c0_g1_i1.p1 TRINITY_DN63627_c0_g1~~TRINITY_DN63627_c0_g1_i1.p1  ORF type:complete len:233 (-),score=51.76 TRINITY_DN63627_c0_g1_i1:193-807(-)